MTILYVTYQGDPGTRFDRDYYEARHLPLVMESWGRYGLLSCAAFFPPVVRAGTIAICECRFCDDASMQAALAAPESSGIMADVAKFTDVKPAQSRIEPI